MNLSNTVACGISLICGMACSLGATERPSLDRCITTALEVNPDVRSASARITAAMAAIEEASSAFYPQIGLAGTWARTDNPPQAFFMSLNQRRASLQKDFNNPEDAENARGSVTAQWRVYDSGRREADRETVALGARAESYSLETVRNELVFEVTHATLSLLQAREFVAVQQEAVASLEEHLRIANARVATGGALKIDVLNLEVQLSQAREERIRANNRVELALAALNAAIGKDLVQMADVPFLTDHMSLIAGKASVEAAPESRPEWGAAQARIGMAEAMTKRARRDYLPVVNAFGSVDWDSEPFSGPEQSYLVGAVVELNLFDGFRTRAGLARASAALISAQAQADKLRTMLALDVTRSRLKEREARERLEIAAKGIAVAEEALRITRERYVQGVAEVTDLITVQTGLTAMKARQVAAHYDHLIALADIERAGGRLAATRAHKVSGMDLVEEHSGAARKVSQ